MRPGKQEWTGVQDLFRARLDLIINLKLELVRLAGEIDWGWIDTELAGCFSDDGRPGTTTRFMVGLLLLKHIHGLSDEDVCARSDGHPGRNYLKGRHGDHTNAVLSAVGHNLRLVLRWLRLLLRQILGVILDRVTP